MIHFKLYRNRIITYSIEIMRKKFAVFIALFILSFVFAVYYLLFGIFNNHLSRDFYIYLCLTIFMLIVILRLFFYYVRGFKHSFDSNENNDEMIYAIYKEEDEYVLNNITRKTVGRVKIKDIKSIRSSKNYIFLTAVNDYMIFPKTEELVSFFDLKK